MIDRTVAVEDVDPAAFAHLNAVLSRRSASTKTAMTVVHDGEVQDVEALRREKGVDELVLLDRRGLDDLSRVLVELARSTDDQGELLARCRAAYLDHWAVTVVPASSTEDGWAPVRELLGRVADGAWVEVTAGDWVLAAEVRGGRVVRITSAPPADGVRAVRVAGTVPDFDAVLSAADSLGELRARAAAGSVRIEVQGEEQWPV